MASEKVMKGQILDFAVQMKKLVNNKEHRYVLHPLKDNFEEVLSFFLYTGVLSKNMCFTVYGRVIVLIIR